MRTRSLPHNPGAVTGSPTSFVSKMEGLLSNITSTCPSQFSGSSGLLFARTIAAVVAAHCGAVDGHKWPEDKSFDIINNKDLSFDFIIVGAGTAGSLLACQLSEKFPNWKILLIEAGNDPSQDTEIPGLLFSTSDNNTDWMYKTEPGNKICRGYINNSCIWNKGKVMGGSSSINAMIFLRGHPHDYDEWETMGNAGWSYKKVRSYFEKIEDWLRLNEYPAHKKFKSNPLYNTLKNAYEELNIPFDLNHNNEVNFGAKIAKLLTANGKRLNTAKKCLSNNYKNIQLMKNTIVKQVVINESSNTALGVEIKHLESGKEMIKLASKEVILSAGSIGTPQVLMLSGIGVQNKNNDNLYVGQNLQDHIILLLLFKIDEKHSRTISDEDISMIFLQYMLNKSGPLSSVGIVDFMTFINTNNDNVKPNIQLLHTHYSKNDNFVLKKYFQGIGLKQDILKEIENLNRKNNLLGVFINLLNPKSKGEIKLKNSNPETAPLIFPNYLEHSDDLNTILKAIDIVKNLEVTNSFKSLGIQLANLTIKDCSQYDNGTRDYWKCYASHMATTLYHPVGTVKMGPKSDKTAVVDENLKVYNVNKLRVVDASIMPTITSSNTMAPVLMIAQKAADMIEKQYKIKDEL